MSWNPKPHPNSLTPPPLASQPRPWMPSPPLPRSTISFSDPPNSGTLRPPDSTAIPTPAFPPLQSPERAGSGGGGGDGLRIFAQGRRQELRRPRRVSQSVSLSVSVLSYPSPSSISFVGGSFNPLFIAETVMAAAESDAMYVGAWGWAIRRSLFGIAGMQMLLRFVAHEIRSRDVNRPRLESAPWRTFHPVSDFFSRKKSCVGERKEGVLLGMMIQF
jgi:hypothetical protein